MHPQYMDTHVRVYESTYIYVWGVHVFVTSKRKCRCFWRTACVSVRCMCRAPAAPSTRPSNQTDGSKERREKTGGVCGVFFKHWIVWVYLADAQKKRKEEEEKGRERHFTNPNRQTLFVGYLDLSGELGDSVRAHAPYFYLSTCRCNGKEIHKKRHPCLQRQRRERRDLFPLPAKLRDSALFHLGLLHSEQRP